jgi:hypothetical protein
MDDGQWREYSDASGTVIGATLHLGPVFQGEVSWGEYAKGMYWRAHLNGQVMGGYPTMAAAKERIEWEVWNRIRIMIPSYRRVMARRELRKIGVSR